MRKANRILFSLIGLLSILFTLAPICTADVTVEVPEKSQEHSLWCWAGTSQAVLEYYGAVVSQCDIANWAWSREDCCGNSDFNWDHACNQRNSMSGAGGSLQAILANWGVNSNSLSTYLAKTVIVSEIDAGRPFVMRFGWTAGGGHALGGYGYDQGADFIDYMDPWPGNGYTKSLYDWVVSSSDHSWTDTLQITTSVQSTNFWATYGGDYTDVAYSIKQTDDGGYIIAGHSGSFYEIFVIWVLKLDRNANVQWGKLYYYHHYNDGWHENAYPSIHKTDDGGYMLFWNAQNSNGVWDDILMVKLDASGEIEWDKTFSAESIDSELFASTIQQTKDGGYMLAWVKNDSSNDNYIFAMKINADGEIQWHKTYYDTVPGDSASSMQETNDGGYIVAGRTYVFNDDGNASHGDLLVMQLDRNGNVEWQKTYGGNSWDYASSVQQTGDGGYIVGGVTCSFHSECRNWIIKLDGNGDIRWQKEYGTSAHTGIKSVDQTADGGYIVSTATGRFGAGGFDNLILKIDGNGEIQWQKTYGWAVDDVLYSIQQTRDGGYAFVGQTYMVDSQNYDMWVMKVNANGNIGGTCSSIIGNVGITPQGTSATIRLPNFSSRESRALNRKWSVQPEEKLPKSNICTASVSGTLEVTPSDDLSSSGPQGGPFNPTSKTYTLRNTGGFSINWAALLSLDSNWITLSSTNGTLGANATATVTVSINSNANSLPLGNRSDTVFFRNTTNGNGDTSRGIDVTVYSPPFLEVTPSDGLSSSGPQGGPFSPDYKLYTIRNIGGGTLSWTASKSQSWVTLYGTGGTLSAGESTTITVQINSQANALQPGNYSDTVSFTNMTSGKVKCF